MERKRYYKASKAEKFLKIFLRILLFPFVIVYLIVMAKKRRNARIAEREQIKIYEKSQVDSLAGIDFEIMLKSLFEKMGFAAEQTKTTGDFGADLILEKEGKYSLVQAKRYNHTVGVRAVQEIVSARAYYKIENAYVVTNNEFSKEAIELAKNAKVHLIDGKNLQNLLERYDIRISSKSVPVGLISEAERVKIQQKYRSLI